MRMKFCFSFIVVLLGISTAIAQTDSPSIDSYIESMRADLRADKTAIVTEAMQFNDADAKTFWPIYRKYEAELTKVNDQRVQLIKSYADKFGSMNDADAQTFIDNGLDFESRRTDVKKKYAKEFLKAGLSPMTVAKFFQLEHRLDLLVDLQIASQLPSLLVKPASATTTTK